MSAVPTANLVGITGIARRLVMDGALEEGSAREALDKATADRKPVAAWLREHKLVTAAQMAAANSIEFGMPVFDPATMDGSMSAVKLVSEDGAEVAYTQMQHLDGAEVWRAFKLRGNPPRPLGVGALRPNPWRRGTMVTLLSTAVTPSSKC